MISMQSTRHISLFAAAVFLAATTAMAQQGAIGGAQSTPNQPQQPGQPANPGSEMGMPTATGNMGSMNNSNSQVDQAFVRDTLQVNKAQLQMSQLAQQKSTSDDVKEFGQKMVQVRTQLDDQLKPIAKQMGVSEPKNPSKKEKQEIAKLEALSGPDFDSAYIQYMAKDQQHSLKLFKEEATVAQNPNVKQAAKMDEPVLSQHLQVLQKLAQSHNVTLESKK